MRRSRKIRKVVKIEPVTIDSQNQPSMIRKGQVSKRSNLVKVPASRTRVYRQNTKPKPYVTPKHFKNVEPIWSGETVYLIGGGPSLKGFEWNRLRGKKTIAINKAIKFWPEADAMYWTDGRIWTWLEKEIQDYKGLKFTIRPKPYPSDVHILRRGIKFGLEKAKNTIAHGNNSGYAAINLAIHLGAKRIILLGYDMGNDGKSSHFHDGYPSNATSEKIYKDQFLPGFDVLKDCLKGTGIQIFNACPTSKLKTFKRISIEEALAFR